MLTFQSHSPTQTEQLAQQLASFLHAGDVLAFTGDLGAGKTTFVRGLAKGVGACHPVSSPTFALVQEYGGTPPLVHFDMYRIQSIDDLYSCGYFDYLEGDCLLAIEWSERITAWLPSHTLFLSMYKTSDTSREITLKGEEHIDALSGGQLG